MNRRPEFVSSLHLMGSLLLSVSIAGCSPSPIIDSAYLRGSSNAALRTLEGAEKIEGSNSAEAISLYQQALASSEIDQGFAEYQKTFAEEIQTYQNSNGRSALSKNVGRGIPEVFARQVSVKARAHQGLARIYLNRKDWAKAETEATAATIVMKGCQFCPYANARSLRESNRILEKVYQSQGATGKALIRRLNADLLDDHLASEGGVVDFYVEKKVLFGEMSQQSMAAIESLNESVLAYQKMQHTASMSAVAGGLMAVNAGLQQGLAQSALAESGGVMTPQVQMSQMTAQMAMMQTQLFTAMVTSQANAGSSALQVNTTPWAIPSFMQQLIDPKQGANTPSIIKSFATTAAQSGGSSVQTSARQLTQGVDALQQLDKDSRTNGMDTKVKIFADAFNSFLTQVQEMKRSMN